jgi:PKD repeat protein
MVVRAVPALVLVGLFLSGCLGPAKHDAAGPEGDTHHSTGGDLRADFEWAPANPAPGQSVAFRDLSTGPVETRAWDFGDATASTDSHPSHAYAAGGVYRVTLRVKDAQGNEADVLHLVAVSKSGTQPSGTDGPGGPGGAPVDLPQFGKPVLVRSDNGGEPSLAIDAQGAFYVNPPGALYKSSDGRAFAQLTYPRTISGDSHVVADLDGRLWISDLEGTGLGAGPAVVPLLGPSSVWTSTDGGATWPKGNPAASMTPFNDRQWLAVTSGGAGFLLYRSCTVPLPIGCLSVGSLLTKTTDAGLTWTPLSSTFEWTSFPFANRHDGTLYVVQSTGPGISVATSTSGGSSFNEVSVATRRTETGDSFVNGAVDDAGNAYVVWADRDRGQTDVYLATSTNRGQTWKGPFLVSASVGTHVFPWVAAGGDGKVVVAWYGTDVKGDPNSVDAKTAWYVNVAQSVNAHDLQPVFSQVRAVADPVHVGAICTGGLACTGDRDLLDFFTIQVAPDGRAAIAYAADGATSATKTMFVLQTDGTRSR